MKQREIIVPEAMKLIPERIGYAPGVKIGGFLFARARSDGRPISRLSSIQKRNSLQLGRISMRFFTKAGVHLMISSN